MTANLALALQISLLGMGLVFAVILLIWGLMALLAAIPAKPEPDGPAKPARKITGTDERQLRARAAAAAVGVALAARRESSCRPLSVPPTALVSAWQLGLRTRQMTQKGNWRR